RQRQDITDCQVELSAERAEDVPKVFTKIHVHYVVKGKALDEKKVARAVDMTAEKYCSVSIMLAQCAEVTHDYEIIEHQD
ncbi:MAG: OsmC family protein, partial [Gammaproteobacteria bacterium]|nr:OsmC family protein [Gammaproteobacteria bacterium]